MKVSYNWLKDYINTGLAPEKMAEVLTMAGLSVEAVTPSGKDHILEIEITANRPDWLSMIGVARELAAITGGKLKVPGVDKIKTVSDVPAVKVKVTDKKLCPRYTARVIAGVKVAESPQWIKEKISSVGSRPVNNIVDVTNFCLFETGEPMHAFDLDKIEGREIVVRSALNREKIVTIDGIERVLDPSILVIADAKKPIAIAGVMGGIATEVTASTKNILLEAACFDQVSIRRTSRKLALSTESSYRFERKVDLLHIPQFSDRAANLINELAGGRCGKFIDAGTASGAAKTINLRSDMVEKVIGAEIPQAKVKKILTALGVKIKPASNDILKASPPPFRYDLNNEIDLIEEVLRVYGYNNIPDTIPQIVDQPVRSSPEAIAAKKLKAYLAASGCDEIITYSLMNKKQAVVMNLTGAEPVEVRNPLTSEQEMMRPSLLPGMLGAILWNVNRKAKDLKLFELGPVYSKISGNSFKETPSLSVGITGQTCADWDGVVRQGSFFDVKGLIEEALTRLGTGSIRFVRTDNKNFAPGACASVQIDGADHGIIGEVAKNILHDFDIKDRVFYAELKLDTVLSKPEAVKRFKELERYPSVLRDISILADKSSSNEDITSCIKNSAGILLKTVDLVDRYAGKQIPDGKISLTYRLEYQDPSKTLEEKEVVAVHSRVLQDLEQKLGAKLR